jgi:hypothetical protein
VSSLLKFTSPAPISIAYSIKHPYAFRSGNFFSVAPAIYKPGKFGIRLKNVFEVVGDETDSGFFSMKSVTLVPFQTKMIDRNSLSTRDVSIGFSSQLTRSEFFFYSRNNG